MFPFRKRDPFLGMNWPSLLTFGMCTPHQMSVTGIKSVLSHCFSVAVGLTSKGIGSLSPHLDDTWPFYGSGRT